MIKTRTTTVVSNLNSMTGIFYFGQSAIVLFTNCIFSQGTIQLGLKGVNKIALIYTVDQSSLMVLNTSFANLTLREARIYLGGSYSTMLFINNLFINLNHTCYENPSSNCLYYNFDIASYNLVNFTNCTFFNHLVQTGNNFMRFYSYNNVFFTNTSLTKVQLVNNSAVYLMYFVSYNQVRMENVNFINYTVGFSAGFIYLDTKNVVKLYRTIFNANNIPTNGGQVMYLSQGNQLYFFNTSIMNAYSVFRNNLWVLQNNYIYYEGCYIYNVTGSRGGLSSIANTGNMYIINNSVVNAANCVNQGSLVYVIISNNNVQIYGTLVFNDYAKMDGAVCYIESYHIFIMQDSTIIYSYSNMYGGFLSASDNNLFTIKNCTFISSLSVSNGGAINILQSNVLTLSNSTFINCSSARSQAGVLFSFLNNTVLFDNVIFLGNYAVQEGGCFFFDSNNFFNITNSRINSTKSLYSDGGFLLIKQNNTIFIINSTFNNSQANLDGGVMKAQKLNSITIINNTFSFITSLQNGGVFYLDANNILIIRNCSIFISVAVKGGIANMAFSNKVRISNSTFNRSSSVFEGGGFWADDTNNISIRMSSFDGTHNQMENGGLVYLNKNNWLSLNSSVFSDIWTESYGGLLYGFQNNTILMNLCNISTIFAYIDGSFAFLNLENSMNLTQIYIQNQQFFGFLYIVDNNTISLENVSFLINSASFNNYMIFMLVNNTGIIKNSSFILENSNRGDLNLIFLINYNNLTINQSFILFDKCEKLFSINLGSFLRIISFKLKNFSSGTLSFIDCQNATFIAEQFFIKYVTMLLFFNLNHSKIVLFDFSFVISNEATSFLVSNSCQIIFKKGLISREKLVNHTQVFLFKDSVIKFINVDVHGFAYKESGGIGLMVDSNLFLIKSIFLINRSWKNGGFLQISFTETGGFSQNASILMYKTIVLESKSFGVGGFLYIESFNSFPKNLQILFKRSSFFNNIASRGGFLYSINSKNTTVWLSKFLRNKAFSYQKSNLLSKGGAFYVVHNESNNEVDFEDGTIYVINSTFKENKADVGSVLFTERISSDSIKNLKNKFSLNEAYLYGNPFATESYKIRFFTLEKNLLTDFSPFIDDFTSLSINNIKSGFNYSECLVKINAYDRFGTITYYNDESLFSQILITQTSPQLNTNAFSFVMSEGFLCLKGFIIRNQLPLMGTFSYEITPLFPLYSLEILTLNLNFKECDIGDHLDANNECVPCDPNTFSFVSDFSIYSDICKTCDNQNFNCFGGGNYTPKSGYWRMTSHSPNFYKCLNQDACLGDPRNLIDARNGYLEIYARGLCQTGYTNVLCAICDEGYGNIRGSQCASCDHQDYYWNVLGNLLLRVFFALYLVNIAVNMCISLMNDKPNKSRIIATNLLKILTNHMQILGIILKLPLSISVGLITSSQFLLSISPNVSEAFSVECIARKLSINISQLYFKLIVAGIYPTILVILYLILVKFVKFYKSKLNSSATYSMFLNSNNIASIISRKLLSYKELIMSVFSLVCLTSYADISNMALAMFGCVKISDGKTEKNLLFDDLSINCDSNYHQMWIKQLSVPIIIFFMFVYPAYIIVSIYYHLNNPPIEQKFFFKFGYFFYAYKRNFFFWDFVILVRKLLLIFVNHFFFSSVTESIEYYPIMVMLLIITFAFLVQIYCKPFQQETFYFINGIEEFSLVVSFFTVSCLLIILSSSNNSLTQFLIAAMIIANTGFFLWWFKKYYDYFFKEKVVNFIKWMAFWTKPNIKSDIQMQKAKNKVSTEGKVMKIVSKVAPKGNLKIKEFKITKKKNNEENNNEQHSFKEENINENVKQNF